MEQQNQQPIQQQTGNKLPAKTNWKYITIVVVLGLIVLWIGWVAVIRLLLRPASPLDIKIVSTPSLTPVQLDTSTWQTYRNEEFGFEVKYPENFFSKLYSADDRKDEVLRIDFAENKWKDQGVHNPALQLRVIRTHLSPREWLDKNYDPLPPNYNDAPAGHYQQVSDTTINGMPALKFNLLFTSGSNLSTIIQKESDLLCYFGAHSSSLGTFSPELYDQILSTFRFVE